MEINLKKLTGMVVAFVVMAFFILTTSLPKSEVITVHETDILSSEIERIDSRRADLMDPVIKVVYFAPFGPVASATGFSFKYDKKANESYILTNEHFCNIVNEGPGFFTYESSDQPIGLGYTIKDYRRNSMELVAMDPILDLCVLKVPKYIPTVKLARKNYEPSNMEPVLSIGAPEGVFPVANEAFVTGLVDRGVMDQYKDDGGMFYFLSGMYYHGQSGSPVFNKHGKVIGVMFVRIGADNGGVMYGGFAIPIVDVYQFLDDNQLR
jgi:S1-C subfamily serine protease